MIYVFGSVNVDIVTRVDRLPGAGETVKGQRYVLVAGGKGANQAVAAARAGADVAMIGAVGKDSFAATGLGTLKADGVDISRVAHTRAPTGIATIAVDATGENCIVVASGANGLATAGALADAAPGPGDILLTQQEVGADETVKAIALAKKGGVLVIHNAAPAAAIGREALAAVDHMIMNESEVLLVCRELGLMAATPQECGELLAAEFGLCAIVTLGAAGAVAFAGEAQLACPALKVDVVDTTGAGDTFCGAFAAALARGDGLEQALAYGVTAGSLACTRKGAQTSIPHHKEIAAAMVGN